MDTNHEFRALVRAIQEVWQEIGPDVIASCGDDWEDAAMDCCIDRLPDYLRPSLHALYDAHGRPTVLESLTTHCQLGC